MNREAKRKLTHELAMKYGVSLNLCKKAVEAGVHTRAEVLAADTPDPKQAFIAAVNALLSKPIKKLPKLAQLEKR